jgi:stearoyl-CoA desaturase (delta-9 desaturase)
MSAMLPGMSRAHKLVNLFAVVLPFAAFLAAVITLWNRYVTWSHLAILVGMYLVTALGITVGYHRLFTHRAFETSRWLRVTFAILGSMAVEGPVLGWVADHRKHHAFSDQEGDPHSPHVGHGEGLLAAFRGLYHAHIGWLFQHEGMTSARRYAKDLVVDRDLRLVSRLFGLFVVLGLLLPAGIAYLIGGTLEAALLGLLWGGLVRVFFVHHITWSINSVCHFFGRRRFDTKDESRNVFWLALPSLGEAWHHNHHAFPSSAMHGLRWWEVDLSGLVIRGLERIGLAWKVVRVTPERVAEREDRAERKRREAVPAG